MIKDGNHGAWAGLAHTQVGPKGDRGAVIQISESRAAREVGPS